MKNFLIAGLLVVTTTAHATSEREQCYTTADLLLNFAKARDAGMPIEVLQKTIKKGMAGPGPEDKDAKTERALLKSAVTVYQADNQTPAAIHNIFLSDCLKNVENAK